MKTTLIPDLYIRSLNDLDVRILHEKGIKMLLLDLDNTLSGHGSTQADTYAIKQIRRLQQAQIDCIIFSNALHDRAKIYSESADIRFVPSPRKPSRRGIRWVLKTHPDIHFNELALIGDQIFTDVLAGKRAGIFTILVDPLGEGETFKICAKRMIEKFIKKTLKINYDNSSANTL